MNSQSTNAIPKSRGKQNQSNYPLHFDAPTTNPRGLSQLIDQSKMFQPQCRRISGWQEQALARIDTNKIQKRRGQLNRSKRSQMEQDYQRNLYQLKKEAEFLESDDEQMKSGEDFPEQLQPQQIHRKKARFPTQSDITTLLARETKYFPSKKSCIDLIDEQQQNGFRKVGISSSIYLRETKKKIPMRPPPTNLRIKQRPSTSIPVLHEQPLLITSLKPECTGAQSLGLELGFQPIHTVTKTRFRQRRKARLMTDLCYQVNPEEQPPTAGLIGNITVTKPDKSEFCNINESSLPNRLLIFRKYNQMIRGKKLRTYRTSAVAI